MSVFILAIFYLIAYCRFNKRKKLKTDKKTNSGNCNELLVNVDGQYFIFVDVPGDGDCFYHSLLSHC